MRGAFTPPVHLSGHDLAICEVIDMKLGTKFLQIKLLHYSNPSKVYHRDLASVQIDLVAAYTDSGKLSRKCEYPPDKARCIIQIQARFTKVSLDKAQTAHSLQRRGVS